MNTEWCNCSVYYALAAQALHRLKYYYYFKCAGKCRAEWSLRTTCFI